MLDNLIKTVKTAASIITTAQDIEHNTEEKGERNFVTVYDKKVQSFLTEELKRQYPEISFLGEEEDSKVDPYKDKCFICDPIDGTANFRRKYNHSAISLAYCENGTVMAGVVYDPFLDELFYAEKGQGAFLNGKRIFVSDSNLKHSFLAFGTAPYYTDLSLKTTQALSKIIHDVEDIRRTGSAALDLAYVACGRHDVFFELSLFPWDYAASIVIIKEAGGTITDFEGNSLPLDKRTAVIAGNKNAYKEFFDKNYFI